MRPVFRFLSDIVERAESLDPASDKTAEVVSKAVPGGFVKDLLAGTWLGHPLHPVLTDVPIGAWTTALVFDTVDAGSRAWPWQQTARRRADDAILVGIIGAVGAALAGMTDWQHTDGKARRTGLAHAALNTVALGLYTGSLVMRRRGARGTGRSLAAAG